MAVFLKGDSRLFRLKRCWILLTYVEKNVYEVNYKLQELSEMLSRTSFIQIARTIILNINKTRE